MRRIVIALAVFLTSFAASTAPAFDEGFLCSAGPKDGESCDADDACAGSPVNGACVLMQGVCDGGEYDGFLCDCPGGTCVESTCAGGAFSGDPCDPTADYNCGGDLVCVGSQRICGGGEFKGYGCLRSEHCGDAISCLSTGKYCAGGDFSDFSCNDDGDCNAASSDGECLTPEGVEPTPTPLACVGDCNNNGEVTVDELIRGVNIALGSLQLSVCPEFDSNSDAEVTINEIIQAVNAALLGCVIPTATPTQPVATPTATPTLGSLNPGRAIAGRAALIANGLGAFPPLVTAIIRGLQMSQTVGLNSDGDQGLVASVLAPQATCPGGGEVVSSCTGVGNVTINISFTGCTLGAGTGSVTFESGSIVLRGAGACPNVVVAAPVLSEDIQLTATFRDSTGAPKLLITANVMGSVTSINVNPGVACFLNGGDVTLNGAITAQIPGGAASRIDFNGTAVNFQITQFNTDCVPLNYRLTFNGSDRVSDPTTGDTFDAVLQNFVTALDSSVDPARVDISGGVTSACFGGAAALATEISMSPLEGSLCFAAGRLRVAAAGTEYRALYGPDGSVGIDLDGDLIADEQHASCTAESLRACLP